MIIFSNQSITLYCKSKMSAASIDERLKEFEEKLSKRLEREGITTANTEDWYRCYTEEIINEKETKLTDTFKKLEPSCKYLEENRDKDDTDYKKRLHAALPTSDHFDEFCKRSADSNNKDITIMNIKKSINTKTLEKVYCAPGEFFVDFDVKSMGAESETHSMSGLHTVSETKPDESKTNVEFGSNFVSPPDGVHDQKVYLAHGVCVNPCNLQEEDYIDSDLMTLVELLVPTTTLEKKAEITKLFFKCMNK